MTIHKDLNQILESKPKGTFLANRDYYSDSKFTLEDQFDNSHQGFKNLKKNYDLSINNYFQTGMVFYDTQIINRKTKEEIKNLVTKYPFTRTNEQGIMNLYFIHEKKLYQELPRKVNDYNTYSYWKNDENTIITKQLVENFK